MGRWASPSITNSEYPRIENGMSVSHYNALAGGYASSVLHSKGSGYEPLLVEIGRLVSRLVGILRR